MTLKDYFESVKGRGVLATADADGRVDAAIYATPHFIDDETIAFIMRDRLTNPMLMQLTCSWNQEEALQERDFFSPRPEKSRTVSFSIHCGEGRIIVMKRIRNF
jgi:hypothetical protein